MNLLTASLFKRMGLVEAEPIPPPETVYDFGPEGFEGSGFPDGWVEILDADPDYDVDPIEGSQSLRVAGPGFSQFQGARAPYVIPAGAQFYMRFKLRFDVIPTTYAAIVRLTKQTTGEIQNQVFIGKTDGFTYLVINQGEAGGTGFIDPPPVTGVEYYLTIRGNQNWTRNMWCTEAETLSDVPPTVADVVLEDNQGPTEIAVGMSSIGVMVLDRFLIHSLPPADFDNTGLYPRWVAEPTISPSSGTTGTVFTKTDGAVAGLPTIVKTVEVYFDGEEVSADLIGNTYTAPAGMQLASVTKYDNGTNPPAIRILSVETTPPVLSGNDLARTATVEKYAHDGVLFEFDAPRVVGHFIAGYGLGDVFVVGATQVSYRSPAMLIEGGTVRCNGAEKNPGGGVATGGYDSRQQYDAAKNDGLSTINLSPGDTLMVAVRYEGDPVGAYPVMIDHIVILTCVAA